MPAALNDAIAEVPAGAWAVGVSGGADSVALLTLLATQRPDCRLVVAHLDHHLRGVESDADAAFVSDLATRLGLPFELARRDAIEATAGRMPANPSARYRAARLIWFAEVVKRHRLDGVLLAHHADDTAETVLFRLLRGSGLTNLGGIRRDLALRQVDRMFAVRTPADAPGPWPICVLHPLVNIYRAACREWLTSIGQAWREDLSNASSVYRRNIVRRVLKQNPSLTPLLLELGELSWRLSQAASTAAAPLDRTFAARDLRTPQILARTAAMKWLISRGVPPGRVTTQVCDRLIAQALDVTQSPRQHYPGRVLVRRRAGRVDVIPSRAVQSPADGQETDAPAEL